MAASGWPEITHQWPEISKAFITSSINFDMAPMRIKLSYRVLGRWRMACDKTAMASFRKFLSISTPI